jgi:hypothetical protein
LREVRADDFRADDRGQTVDGEVHGTQPYGLVPPILPPMDEGHKCRHNKVPVYWKDRII